MDDSVQNLDRDVGVAFFNQFSELRPVQNAAIREILSGKNVLISAGTGSGKTEAVVAPLVSRFREEAIQSSRTFLIYVCPTKALINDLTRRLAGPLEQCGLKLAVRHGDRDELSEANPPHVLLTTPESLGILFIKKHPLLLGVNAVVLDEVHLLYNSQRGCMVAILMHRLQNLARTQIQFAAISATVGRLDDIRSFLFGNLENFSCLSFRASRTIDGTIRIITKVEELGATLAKLMQTPRKLLVFTNSRREAEDVSACLKKYSTLTNFVVTHHSSLSPESREATESFFSAASSAICVATSTLEMGIDIGDIDAVVLYGPPATIESMLQRIGRGNRRLHKTNAICFARTDRTNIREAAVFSAMLGMAAKGQMPTQEPFRIYGALAQQCLALILENDGSYTRTADITEQLRFREDITRDLAEGMLSELEANGVLRNHGFKNRFGADERLWDLRDKNLIWGNFPLASQQIDLVYRERHLGSIPRANLMRLSAGKSFRFGGSRYRVASIVDQKIQVNLVGGSGDDVPIVYSNSGFGGMETFIADSIWDWIFNIEFEASYMSSSEWKNVSDILEPIRKCLTISDLPYYADTEAFHYYTFAGAALNQVIIEWSGFNKIQCNDIYISVSKKIDWKSIPLTCVELKDAAEKCFNKSDRQTLFQQMLPLDLQRIEWLETFIKDVDANRVLGRLKRAVPKIIPPNLFNPLIKFNDRA